MEPSSSLFGVSFRKKPRSGQARVFKALETHTASLNIKLPTGYGKTFAMSGVYSILMKQRRVNRLLVIFPTTAQIEQFKTDGATDLKDTGVSGPLDIVDISFYSTNAIKKHRKNIAQIYVITVQALCESRGMNNCIDLLSTGQWMICVDEYHHYGVDKSWGQAVLTLSRAFLLAMSATPTRKNRDSAFGVPDVSVSYRDAKEEGAVKPLKGHAYNYRIDAVLDDGEIASFTTAELVKEAGGDDPDKIEKLRIKRKMRWSPKYVSPLIRIPIERMLTERVSTGFKLQAQVGAMCVSHAELVCGQLRDMYPELKIDWVGTGDNGRSIEENKTVLAAFCPPKDQDGNRPPPALDVLVHVGMAGEGLDTIYVSEVIHLNNASLCNRRNQENGRASRYLRGVIGNINFDSSGEYALEGYVGDKIMDAMDEQPPKPGEDDTPPKTRDELDLPDEPYIQILNMELINVDSGDPGVQRMARVLEDLGAGPNLDIDWDAINQDLSHDDWNKVITAYRNMRTREAKPQDEAAIIAQWKDAVMNATTAITGRVTRMMARNGARIEKSLLGDIKRRINTAKKAKFGPIQADVEVCRRHYEWLMELQSELKTKGIPSWLS